MTRFSRPARIWAFLLLAALLPAQVSAAPFAAYVMDARTGQPIYKQNADTKLHPASLTKMMTLYLAFTAIERGQVRLDSLFTVSSHAASQPPSKLGLRPGQKIELRYLLRAAAIKSANDAATTIGEGLAGSEAGFAQQMTQMARALGMRNTQFRNANGLTREGHYSTAHDMTILGRHLFYDFPQYYNLFSRRSADAGIAQVSSTNKRFLDAYRGADGIKTGYTRAAGFNLTASAQRGNKRLIASVFGGTSTAQRNEVMSQLLDSGFTRVPERVRETRPQQPQFLVQKVVRKAQIEPSPAVTSPNTQNLVLRTSAKPMRVDRASLLASPSPAPRADIAEAVQMAVGTPAARSSMALSASARPKMRPGGRGDAVAEAVAAAVAGPDDQSASLGDPLLSSSSRPKPAPRSRGNAESASLAAPALEQQAEDPMAEDRIAAAVALAETDSMSLLSSSTPRPRTDTVILAAMGEGDISAPEAQEVVSRPSASGRSWGVSLGLHRSKATADKILMRSALQDGALLRGAHRQVANTARGFDATFVNMSKNDANLLCDRFRSRAEACQVLGP